MRTWARHQSSRGRPGSPTRPRQAHHSHEDLRTAWKPLLGLLWVLAPRLDNRHAVDNWQSDRPNKDKKGASGCGRPVWLCPGKFNYQHWVKRSWRERQYVIVVIWFLLWALYTVVRVNLGLNFLEVQVPSPFPLSVGTSDCWKAKKAWECCHHRTNLYNVHGHTLKRTKWQWQHVAFPYITVSSLCFLVIHANYKLNS